MARILDRANNAAFKDLLDIIKFDLDMHNYWLKIKPKSANMSEFWIITMFSDSNYAWDTDTWTSMTGYCFFLMGIPVSWKVVSRRA